MYTEILNKYEIFKLRENGFVNNEWFVGSALMGHNFKQFREGIYYYYQETIWTRVLDLECINPYWEIYNRTYNFLLVDKPCSLAINFLLDVLEEIKKYFSKDLKFVFITSDSSASDILLENKCEIISANIPFFIEDSLVGNYLKVFVKNDNQFIPLIDCTLFKIENKSYFEVNINKFYIEILNYLLYKNIPPKFTFFEKIFKINIADSFSNFIDIQENIRIVSLFDCLVKLSENNVKISGTYKGHTTKKILKKLALYSVILNYNLEKGYSLLNPEYCVFLKKELEKINHSYPRLMKKYSKEVLKDRYGLTDSVYKYLSGNLTITKINHYLKKTKYFTDIPFISEPLSDDKFKQLITEMIAAKKRR